MDPLPDHIVTTPPLSSASRPATVAVIDLSALAHNVARVRRQIPEGCQILAVLKANAYGHGAVAIARSLVRLGINRFAVSTLAEGIALREAYISAPVLVMGPMLPGEWAGTIAYGLTPVVYDLEQAEGLADALRDHADPYAVHLKIDTGMGRLGTSLEEALPLLQSPPFRGPLRVEGLMTHLADADNQEPAFTHMQLERFRSVVTQSGAAGLRPPLVHAANSAAILQHPSSHFTAVRPGIMLYGYHTLSAQGSMLDLRPVLTLATTIVRVRTLTPGESLSYNRTFVASRATRIAVLPVGYADGYSRLLSNRGVVLIHGRKTSVVGRVCMDMTMVDVTDIHEVHPGHEAVLIGTQGDMRITADDLAAPLGTIPYEVLCAVSARVPRIYKPSTPEP